MVCGRARTSSVCQHFSTGWNLLLFLVVTALVFNGASYKRNTAAEAHIGTHTDTATERRESGLFSLRGRERETHTWRTVHETSCTSHHNDNNNDNERVFPFQERHSNSSGFSFPLPKIVLDASMPSHKPSIERFVRLAEQYNVRVIYADDKQEKDRSPRTETLSQLAVQRFCRREGQPTIKHEGVNMKKNDVLRITSIEIVISKKHDLSHEILRHSEYLSAQHLASFSSSLSRMEAYFVSISPQGKVYIAVNSGHGVIYALNTLSQIIFAPVKRALPLEIIDYAEKDWRGLMIDVSRHFQPISHIERSLDAMAAAKFNVLHLHLTDAQSFPIALEDRLPSFNLSRLATEGSFSADRMYTLSQLRELVSYAAERGIEVVPEIDVPAHALSWGNALSSLVIPCHHTAQSASSQLSSQQNVYPLDPSNPLTFAVVEAVLAQIAEVFPSPFLHIGGDEVMTNCYSESERVMAWAKEHQLGAHNITKYFEMRVFAMVSRLKKIPIVWQGILDEDNMPSELLFAEDTPHPPTTHSNNSTQTSDQMKRNDTSSQPHTARTTHTSTTHNNNIFHDKQRKKEHTRKEQDTQNAVRSVGLGRVRRSLTASDTPQLYFTANTESSFLFEDEPAFEPNKTSSGLYDSV